MKHFNKKKYLGAACVAMISVIVVSANWTWKHEDTNSGTQTSSMPTIKKLTTDQPSNAKTTTESSRDATSVHIQTLNQTDYLDEYSPVDELFEDFDANSFFPTSKEKRHEATKRILDILDLDSGRKEMLSSAIFEKFELDVELNDAYRKVLLNAEATNLEIQSSTDDFNRSSEEARQQYANKLSGILTYDELEVYNENERENIKDYLLSRIPKAAKKLEKQGIGNAGMLAKNLENNLDSLVNERFKTGISLGLLKNNDTGTFSENTSEFSMLTLATEVMHEVAQ